MAKVLKYENRETTNIVVKIFILGYNFKLYLFYVFVINTIELHGYYFFTLL